MDVLEQVQHAREKQIQAASQRYEQAKEDREANQRQRASEGLRVLDTTDQLEARAQRLVRLGRVPADRFLEIATAEERDLPRVVERIIELSDLQSVSFLPRGARAAATVARISLASRGREIPLGTGFLVSPRLLMTNNHVLPDEQAAGSVVVEFGYEMGLENAPSASRRFLLDPAGFYVTDEQLDVTLVLVAPGQDGALPGEQFGWNQLIAEQGKIIIGEPVNVVGHPNGRFKEIAIRNNALEHQLDRFLQYRTDTEPGNSGSPVFNDQWEIVALHHAGVPRTDDQGRYLRRDGQVWQSGDGDDAIDWIANEGARVSMILEYLAGLDFDGPRRAILAEMGAQAGLATAVVEGRSPITAPPVREAVGRLGLPARPGAFGGTTHLLFLHGRRQEGLDPEALRRSWTAGLNRGLTMSGVTPIDPQDVWFPFYGDRFITALDARERRAAPVSVEQLLTNPAEVLAPTEPSTRAVYEALIVEAATAAGMPSSLIKESEERADLEAGLPGWLQGPLSWLANHSGLDAMIIAAMFRDVAAYLDRTEIRRAVLDAVRETIPASGRLVLISHSLGTVVAMDLLTELAPDLNVVQLVTAGSPLGQDAVFTRLLSRGPHRPTHVGHWLNAWCSIDPVAIGCPLGDNWKGQVQEVLTANPAERAHSIEEYLADPSVARAIARGLRG